MLNLSTGAHYRMSLADLAIYLKLDNDTINAPTNWTISDKLLRDGGICV